MSICKHSSSLRCSKAVWTGNLAVLVCLGPSSHLGPWGHTHGVGPTADPLVVAPKSHRYSSLCVFHFHDGSYRQTIFTWVLQMGDGVYLQSLCLGGIVSQPMSELYLMLVCTCICMESLCPSSHSRSRPQYLLIHEEHAHKHSEQCVISTLNCRK